MSQTPREKTGDVSCTQPLSERAQRSSAPAQLRILLVVHHRDGVEVALLLPNQPVVVGRSKPSDLCVTERTLSREHARFTLVGDKIAVVDLGSTNGVWAAGERVQRIDLALGGEVTLGSVLARIYAVGASRDLGPEPEEHFRRQLEEEATRAKHLRRSFSLLAVRAPWRSDAAGAGPWAAQLYGRLRPIDRMSLYSPDTALVLLPETGPRVAGEIARGLALPCGNERIPSLVGVATYPEAARTVEELIELAFQAAGRASACDPVACAPTAAWAESRTAVGAGIVAGAAMRDVIETAMRVAKSRIPVILHGETGTGKEVLARTIHENGPRRGNRMVRVNCGAIPAQLVESTLFGHEKGAFTGAVQQQKGVFEEAANGTVFLDEIGELPLAAQVALLRVLETSRFCRVGSMREIEADVRIIAATHRDLDTMVEQGTFREDLYYRLSTMVIELPPLRERVDEIEALAGHFLKLANESNGCNVRGFAPAVIALLGAYHWPGNVRELKNAIERAVIIAQREVVLPEDLPARLRADAEAIHGSKRQPMEVTEAVSSTRMKTRVKEYEARMLAETLQAAGWNRMEAARTLGIPVRTLAYRMKVLGVKRPGG